MTRRLLRRPARTRRGADGAIFPWFRCDAPRASHEKCVTKTEGCCVQGFGGVKNDRNSTYTSSSLAFLQLVVNLVVAPGVVTDLHDDLVRRHVDTFFGRKVKVVPNALLLVWLQL